MVEAVMFWNEPNNKSHWAFEIDPEWRIFADMVKGAARAVAGVNPRLLRVLGGMSPIDANFVNNLARFGVLDELDVVAVHGFPLDWNHWQINDWPAKLDEIRAVTSLPIWVSEVGVSTFGAEEVQVFGVDRTAELLIGRAPRIHWYSLYDLPKAWPATTRHREAEGSAYYRHFYMGLLREDGSPKPAAEHFARHTPAMGICQWFHFEDHRLDDAVRWLRRLGVKYLRTGLSWADSFRPNADAWFDRQMEALAEFDVTLTFCFTPEHRGVQPHHTSPPQVVEEYAEFCSRMVARYAPAGARTTAPSHSASPLFIRGENSAPLTADAAPLDRLFDPSAEPPRTVVVYAHPDDEAVALGARFSRFTDATFVCVTDGAPADLLDARAYGFATREAYAEARREEQAAAFRRAGVPSARLRRLGYIDQQASLHLAEITRALIDIFRELQPEFVITHPYEGGHPDHDATAFAVHLAARALAADGIAAPLIVEFTSYHQRGDGLEFGEFLAADPAPAAKSFLLDPAEQERKRALLACFVTQRGMLENISLAAERFRLAPAYDFTSLPHPPPLAYERFPWGMNSPRWLELVRAAQASLAREPDDADERVGAVSAATFSSR